MLKDPIKIPEPNLETAVHPRVQLVLDRVEVQHDAFHLGPISLTLQGSQLCCLLGPNGSGKTTLIRVILGLQRANCGFVMLDGDNLAGRPSYLMTRIGYVTDSADDLLLELSPCEYWDFCALAYMRYGFNLERMRSRTSELAAALGLVSSRRSISALSLGMRRKVQLVASMMHEPELLIMDEPLIGLDFISIRALEAAVEAEQRRGALVMMASHDIGFAHRMDARLLLLHNGALIKEEASIAQACPTESELVAMIEASIQNAGKDLLNAQA